MSSNKNNKPNQDFSSNFSHSNFSHYNDYELIYFAKEQDEQAWEILIWKYSFLIRARIKSLKIPYYLSDDFYQEGCLMLLKAVKTFDENKKIPFTSFFDMVLSRRFISLMRKEYNHTIDLIPDEKLDMFSDSKSQESDINNYLLLKENFDDFTTIELKVYNEIIINGKKAKELAEELHIDVKVIYNAKQRVLYKIRSSLKQ